MRPDPARLWADLETLAAIGATPRGGCNRQAATPEDGAARAWLAQQAAAVGATLRVDRIGNMRLLRPGRDPARAPVAIGSHLDTQPTGGRFDGVLGVLAGLEVLRAAQEAGIATRAPLALINWTNEEGARFSPPMMGSGVATGTLEEGAMLAARDPAGETLGGALDRIGWRGEAPPAETAALGAYLELHIEQGAVLERAGAEIGVVTHALGQAWFEVTVTGEEAHAGSVMAHRRDALAAAAPLIAEVEAIARDQGGEARATVGRIALRPDSRNVVPGEVWFTVDLRHGDPAVLAAMEGRLRRSAAACAAARGVAIEVAPFWSFATTPFDPRLTQWVREAAARAGRTALDLPAGIGHDAVSCARRLPTALIFIPCEGGVSHNEAENIRPEWAAAGLAVLADVALRAAMEE